MKNFLRGLLYSSMGLMIPVFGFVILTDSAALMAQEGNSRVLEEVIVTARRRSESLQDIPISVSAFSGNDIEMRNMENLSDIARFTPNLTFDAGSGNTGGSTNAQVFIRGVGQQDFLFTTDPGVGIYVDGVFFSRQMGSIMDLVDLERVEVLRGPQGTLFGRNTIGGAIQMISTMPSDEFSGFGEVSIGRYDRLDLKGTINFPVTENLNAKVSVASLNRDGYTERVDGVELGDINSDAARVLLDWHASDNIKVLFAADYTRRREESISDVALAFNDKAFVLGLWNAYAGGGTYNSRFATNDPFKTNATGESRSDTDTSGIAATIIWDIGSLQVKSITAYRDSEAKFAGDPDNSPLAYLEQNNSINQDQFTQEIQLIGTSFDERLEWMTGAFYLQEEASDLFDTRLAPGLFTGLEALPGPINGSPLDRPTSPGGPGNPLNRGLDPSSIRDTGIEVDSIAIFGHASLALSDRLSLSGGLRYTDDAKDFRVSRFNPDQGLYTIPVGTKASDSWDAWVGKAGTEFRVSDDLMTYFSVSSGFKSGGFNGRPSTVAIAITPFDPEYVTAYEIGFKSSWLANRLVFNAAGFFNDYSDIQLTSVRTSASGGIIVAVDNAGEAEMKGVEVEISALPMENFELNATVGYIDAEYTEINPGVTQVNLDSAFVKTPEWTYSLGGQLTFPMSGNQGEIVLRGDWSYRSSVFHSASNVPILRQDGFGLLGARLVYIAPNANWRVSLAGTNLTDELYLTNGLEALGSFGTADGTYGVPREWILSLHHEF